MLRHWGRNTYNWTGNNGAHQFSLDDGLTWHTFGQLAYPCFATFEDGSSAGFIMCVCGECAVFMRARECVCVCVCVRERERERESERVIVRASARSLAKFVSSRLSHGSRSGCRKHFVS